MDDIKKLLGKRIKELRKEKSLSQETLAEQIGIEPNNLSRIENGKNYPSAETISKIAKALNLEIHKLYCFNHHKEYKEIKKELIRSLDDENFGRQLYKYYALIKE